MAIFNADGAATLQYDNLTKITTSSTGATVTGTLTVTGDLDITGNVNSYNVTDLDVTDQTITLGAGQTEANSGGSGIIIDGSNASILWDETNSEWDFNKTIHISGSSALSTEFKIGNLTWNQNTSSTSGLLHQYRGSDGYSELQINNTASSGAVTLNIRNDSASVATIANDGGAYFAGNVGIGTSSPNTTLTLSDGTDEFDFGVTTNQLLIKSVTSDGSDDQRIIIDAGNGGLSSTRGAYIALSGNEASAEPGHAIYQMGNVTGSAHVFRKAGGSDAVTIDSSGNVGIGEDNPSYQLDILAPTNYRSILIGQAAATGTKRIAIAGRHYDSSEQPHNLIGLFTDASDNSLLNIGGGLGSTGDFNSVTQIQLHTGTGTGTQTTAAMTIDNAGNVGIGTISPGYNLHVEKLSASASVDLLVKNTGTDGTSNSRIMSYVSGASGGDPKIGLGITGVRDYFFRIDNSDSDKLKLDTNGTDIVTIDNSGNVGIGTDSPLSKLHVYSSAATSAPKDDHAVALFDDTEGRIQVRATNSGSDGAVVGLSTGSHNWGLMATAAGTFSNAFAIGYVDTSTDGNVFGVDSMSEKLRITTSGQLIVGSTIHFSGNTSTGFIYEDGVNLQLRSDGAMTFYTYSGSWQVRMTIADGGLISGDFNDTSDVALKENIVAIENGMSVISQMRPVSFDWRDVIGEDKEGNEVTVPAGKGPTKGLIAQEVEAIDAELVVGEEGEKAINTSGVLAYAIKAIQELNTKLEAAEARITELEG
jgi:hypothetical protein